MYARMNPAQEAKMADTVNVIGAGLAGCEAAYQLSKRGMKVKLYDMKPSKFTPAHSYEGFAELVCSNSLRAGNVENSVGLLKEEMRRLDSLIMKAAEATKVEAGGALAVDRKAFSDYVTNVIKNDPDIEFISGEICSLNPDELTVVATGPLTTGKLFENIAELLGQENMHFFDAAAPIVSFDSIDTDITYFASRYGKGTPDYINCPMDKEQYLTFYNELVLAEAAELHGFEKGKVFEGCMPIEVMAKRGEDTMRYGPLKPVGLPDPKTGKDPYAVVQLRRDNREGSMYNIVGFQTHLKFGEQKRVFSMIPGLENAEFLRYGVMHRNAYINSPGKLNEFYQANAYPNLFFAGQMTGVEGYVESASSGLLCGINVYRYAAGKKMIDFTDETAIGALPHYISGGSVGDFQPMNVNFGIMKAPDFKFKGKKDKNTKLAERALAKLDEVLSASEETI